MKVAEFNKNLTLEDALAAVDGLRKDIESGKVVSFVAVGVGPEDATIGYCGSSRPVSKLRVTGAMLTRCYVCGTPRGAGQPNEGRT